MEIRKGMYGILQAGKLANTLLKKRLATCCYIKCMHTSGLWRHIFRPVQFTLVVDDFGIKFDRTSSSCYKSFKRFSLTQQAANIAS